jgi:hypothetical protein
VKDVDRRDKPGHDEIRFRDLTSALLDAISASPGPSGLSAFGGSGDRDDAIE